MTSGVSVVVRTAVEVRVIRNGLIYTVLSRAFCNFVKIPQLTYFFCSTNYQVLSKIGITLAG